MVRMIGQFVLPSRGNPKWHPHGTEPCKLDMGAWSRAPCSDIAGILGFQGLIQIRAVPGVACQTGHGERGVAKRVTVVPEDGDFLRGNDLAMKGKCDVDSSFSQGNQGGKSGTGGFGKGYGAHTQTIWICLNFSASVEMASMPNLL